MHTYIIVHSRWPQRSPENRTPIVDHALLFFFQCIHTRNLLLFSFGKTARQPILWNNTAVADDGSTKIEIPKIYVLCMFIFRYWNFDISCSETLVYFKRQQFTFHKLSTLPRLYNNIELRTNRTGLWTEETKIEFLTRLSSLSIFAWLLIWYKCYMKQIEF